jgi:hypothetical protein
MVSNRLNVTVIAYEYTERFHLLLFAAALTFTHPTLLSITFSTWHDCFLWQKKSRQSGEEGDDTVKLGNA